MSVHWPILKTCLSRRRQTLLSDDRRTYTGRDLLGGALYIAQLIEERSSSPVVGGLLPTSGATAMAALGAWLAGRAFCPFNFLLTPDELDYVIRDSETDLLLTSDLLLQATGHDPRGPSVVKLEDVSFKGFPPLRWPAVRGEDDLAVLLYTSGTSGRPKGVMLSHGNLSSNVRQCVEHVHFTPDDTLLGVLPQFHSFGLTVLTLLPMTVGCGAVYSARFVPQQIVRMFRKHRPTVFVGIPSMYNAMLSVKSAKAEDFASVRIAVSGGEPLPDDVAKRFKERFGVTIAEGYGLTETAPVSNMCCPTEYRPHTVGR
ncbi:MAG: AMP-binding protein, partial [Planctomycetota bacterium]